MPTNTHTYTYSYPYRYINDKHYSLHSGRTGWEVIRRVPSIRWLNTWKDTSNVKPASLPQKEPSTTGLKIIANPSVNSGYHNVVFLLMLLFWYERHFNFFEGKYVMHCKKICILQSDVLIYKYIKTIKNGLIKHNFWI